MPRLVLPTVAVRSSFLAAMAEFAAEGRGGHDDESMIGRDLRAFADSWHTAEGFAAYVEALLRERETPRSADLVPFTTWWWIEGEDFLGRIALRHRLDDRLREYGGHIGYDVRPSARRRGHATAMLRAVLEHAGAMGMGPVLLMCQSDNAASRRVIEANGGRLGDTVEDRLRFWLPTAKTGWEKVRVEGNP
ncbi:GNAT family N-acetyltransferase [Spongiactinospora sp. TRM90649]|uniref:GNAT family N-acetyltransferase n=1 Tax=Spongiactinospora sp. TRM90649 TaxID=3031114 RepID=UPI0023F6F60D|nr:GNAT family N-acetyltransferase [Spongiactinospora sp. TRM90649]MDF5757058.1 GNAT family N-acetyltransferase [Spongiactinospora sp. TRM90649]